jgi:hypothetical protein
MPAIGLVGPVYAQAGTLDIAERRRIPGLLAGEFPNDRWKRIGDPRFLAPIGESIMPAKRQ